MAIEFHCEHCGKMIRAGDEHGGKHGKCPSCHQRVYIPTADIEPLDFAPINAAEDRRAEQMRRESQQLAENLLNDRAPAASGPVANARPEPGNPVRTEGARPAKPAQPPPPPDLNVPDALNEYAIAMFEGELEEAEQLAASLRRHPKQLNDAITRITADEIPPSALEHIPRPVLLAFFKQLRGG